MGLFQGTQERVQNSRGKRAIRVRATEALLCMLHVKRKYNIKEHNVKCERSQGLFHLR